MVRLLRFTPEILQEEGSGSEGTFRHAMAEAGLAKQRRLLIACYTGDDDVFQAKRCGNLPVWLAGGTHFRKNRIGNVQRSKQFRIPRSPMNVVEHGSRCICGIDRVQASAGQLPNEPAVYGAERQLTGIRFLTRAFDIVEDPQDLA